PNTASANSIEPTLSPFRFNTSTFAIVFFFRQDLSQLQFLVRREARSPPRRCLLTLAASLLRSLQRIDRTRSCKSTALARRSLGFRNQHVAFARSRHCTLN